MAVVSAEYHGCDCEGWKLVWNQKQRRKGSKAKQKQPGEAGTLKLKRAGHDAATFSLAPVPGEERTQRESPRWTGGHGTFPVMDTPTETEPVTWWGFGWAVMGLPHR